MTDILRGKLVKRMAIRIEFGKGRKDTNKRQASEDKLRDRLMSRNDGYIKRQACEKDGNTN